MKEEDIIYILLFFPRREREKTLRGFWKQSLQPWRLHTHIRFSFLFIFHFFYGRQSDVRESQKRIEMSAMGYDEDKQAGHL